MSRVNVKKTFNTATQKCLVNKILKVQVTSNFNINL